jgi:D-alanine-D-alanine ligase
MLKRKVGILMGGLSSERKVSITTGEAVLTALLERNVHAVPIFVDRDLDLALRQEAVDIAFIALHGRYGEDGCVQGLLETMGIPYTGSDVLASALAMHKVKAKEVFRLHNLPTPAYYVLGREHEDHIAIRHGDFGYPVVVKPVGEGSSVGVQIAHDESQLVAACERALCFDDEVLVERYVAGQEISVAVLGDRAIGAIEIEPKDEFFDFSAKYTEGLTHYFIPPRLSPERFRGLLSQGLRAHQALGCSGATRVDFIVSPVGNEYVLEVNTLPGLTPKSLLPKIAASQGIDFGDLVTAILSGARLTTVDRGMRDRRVSQRPFTGDERRELGATEPH